VIWTRAVGCPTYARTSIAVRSRPAPVATIAAAIRAAREFNEHVRALFAQA
jgi:hypothetical protein